MSSPSPSPSDEDGGGNGGGGRGAGSDFDGPSSSRRRSSDGVWPEPFVEALASQVAIDASLNIGRLSAARVLSNLFQVCSTWRAVSRSDLLWLTLTRRIWHRDHILRGSWRDEYIYRHRTFYNFSVQRCTYSTLHFVPSNDNNDDDHPLTCRRLALSDHHLAAGFSDGSVSLFHLPTRLHLSTFRPHHHNRLGPFSRAIAGIILTDVQLIFASVDGDVHAVDIENATSLRRAQLGDVVNDGALVDFSGCNRWWVGLYAGVPGRAFHVWDGNREELIFIGSTLTDREARMGWHLLTELNQFIGRVRVTSHELAVACTRVRVIVFDLRSQVVVLGEQEFSRGLIVGSMDASIEAFSVVDGRGVLTVRRVGTMEELCRFMVHEPRSALQMAVLGCMNLGYAVMCSEGVIRFWEVENGNPVDSFIESIGEAMALVADDRYVAACSGDNTIHLWDFGAHQP